MARLVIRAILALLVTIVYIQTLKCGVQAEQIEDLETKSEQSLPEKIEQPQWRIAREAGRENTNDRENKKPSNKKMKKTKTKLRRGKKKIRQKKIKSRKMRTNKRKLKHKKKKKSRNNNKKSRKNKDKSKTDNKKMKNKSRTNNKKMKKTKKLWRDDGRCGLSYPLPNGQPGQCDPTANAKRKGPCCSTSGWCGNTDKHCNCPSCVRFPGPNKENGQCSPQHRCNKEQGDCETDQDCGSGLFCGKNNCWGEFGYTPQGSLKDDCCTDHLNYCSPADILPRSRITCCTPDSPCSAGHGDCDTDNDCESGLVCGHNNCKEFHPDADDKDDCCVNPSSGLPSLRQPPDPSWGFCSSDNLCDVGEGDCSTGDHTCAGDLVCGSNNCGEFHPNANPKMDCCMQNG